ncbi:hypothetical protein IVB38_11655 [Bradyrhizobium sp. 38]|uniref:hypothetical protein n=1 Tax=unclassified Bradyrhizobium TaxID=2631580 RepID=UPI001FF7E88B|nr:MULTISPECIES: hypothetical protein [unclassified Bradyrhizobium]MCK1336666.1 hypothetical protein [Bradyrhizobium sp. 38]MCK1777016.1 hypothetical protein [Bradyrhizobium sp. 132]
MDRKAANMDQKRRQSHRPNRYAASAVVMGRRKFMVNKVCNAAAALTFTVVAVGGFWSFSNSYFICGLALVASLFARRTVERSFIKRAHRDMVRIHGMDWGCADNAHVLFKLRYRRMNAGPPCGLLQRLSSVLTENHLLRRKALCLRRKRRVSRPRSLIEHSP